MLGELATSAAALHCEALRLLRVYSVKNSEPTLGALDLGMF